MVILAAWMAMAHQAVAQPQGQAHPAPPARPELRGTIFLGTDADFKRLAAVRAYDARCDVLSRAARDYLIQQLDLAWMPDDRRDKWNRLGAERAARFVCGSPAGMVLVREGLNPPPKPFRFWR